jgi:nucleotide-binding universal stress UspA family protein
MLNRLLVALDGSRESEAVIPHVARLLGGTNAQATLALVIKEPVPVGRSHVVAGGVQVSIGQFENVPFQEQEVVYEGETEDQAIDRVVRERGVYLDEQADRLRQLGVSVDRTVLLGDDVAQTLAEHAARGTFDAIAMATHGREGLSRLFTGSVCGKVVEKAAAPVMIVKATK